jgi:hypothetical protein
MYGQAQAANATAYAVPSTAPRQIEPLDAELFENLSEDEAEALLASRFCTFIESGWSWKDALLLAVRPDGAVPALPRSGDVSSP